MKEWRVKWGLKGFGEKTSFSFSLPLWLCLLRWQEFKKKNQAEQFVVYEENVDNDKGKIFN